ncbi:MAG: molybdopterin molybdenumtransferase MoeA [Rhizobiales bacterium]|nr:molybdopterin molybdenumtransferase MoeA [Hyphomicrobiales bacterium]
MPVAEALRRVLEGAAPLPAEDATLGAAHGRVLAVDLAARRTQPPDALSAMDGYAARAADVSTVPATLKVIGEVAAGHPFEGQVGPGQAARIFTGGVLPPGADTVVIQENTTRDGDIVVVTTASAKGRHIRVAGLDFKAGAVLLSKGTRLTARDLALAAAMNHPTVPVHRTPKVAVLATGDELVMPGTEPGFGEIVYSNGYATMALARGEGCDVIDLGIVADRLEDTIAAVRRARDAGVDLLVTSGGASVGDYDLVQKALASEGLALSFWKVALRPGRPMMHGRLGAMHVLGLPGNPVSAFVCSVLFLIPLIRRLAGRTDVEPRIETALLGCDLPANDERADYMRATLTDGPRGPVATPFAEQDSSMLVPLAKAGCLLVREAHDPAARAGSRCNILKLGL